MGTMPNANLKRAGRTARDWSLIMAGVMAIMVGLDFWTGDRTDTTPPVEFHATEVLTPTIWAGDVLRVRIHRDKLRPAEECPLNATRTAVEIGGPHRYALEPSAGPGGREGTTFVDLDIATPPFMAPGRYMLQACVTYHCPSFGWGGCAPDAEFEVVR